MAKIDVIIPVAGKSPYLEDSLQSVLRAAKYSDAINSITICDNVSNNPEVSEIANRYAGQGVKYKLYKERLSIFANWNRVIRETSAEWIHLMHDDDLIDERFYADVSNEELSRTDISVITFSHVFFKSLNNTIVGGRLFLFKRRDAWIESMVEGCPTICAATLINKKYFRSIDGFNEEYFYAGDWQFFLKMFLEGEWIMKNSIRAFYRLHESQVSNTLLCKKVVNELATINRRNCDLVNDKEKLQLTPCYSNIKNIASMRNIIVIFKLPLPFKIKLISLELSFLKLGKTFFKKVYETIRNTCHFFKRKH